ncbi:MAG: metalloregulator ArsR/SmtB family transcription factor [Actinobacteria bacterium]|nr:metalloregulator ArsR/SmtB family transcription factor [Actinomycetota bacterium]
MIVGDAGHGHPFDPESVERARSARLSSAEVDRLAEVLSIVGEPVRARIITALLAVEELCVGDVALAADVSEDAASYALRVLRTAGLVQRRRQGRLNFYRLADDDTQPALRSALAELRRLAAATPPPAG